MPGEVRGVRLFFSGDPLGSRKSVVVSTGKELKMRSAMLRVTIIACLCGMVAVPSLVCSAPVSSGSITYENTEIPSLYFLAVVDFEVYGPGDADNPLDPGVYPSVNTEYTYVYTLYNDASSLVPLDGLDVELASGVTVTAAGSIDDGLSSTPAPSSITIGPTILGFDFFDPFIMQTESSEQLFVIAPSAPGDVVLTVVFDGVSEDELGLVAGPVASGAVCGSVGASCYGDPAAPAPGITVDIFNIEGELVATADTDSAGEFCFENLVPDDYLLTMVVPLSYDADVEQVWLTVPAGETVTYEFLLVCKDIVTEPRTIGFWKHQVGVATGGKGRAQIDGPTLCGYLDLIEARFNNNSLNSVAIYEPPASGLCADKLLVARDILKLQGKVPMEWRAKQQLLALLFNVASEKIGLAEIVSDDGAVLSQAITFCDNLIDDPAGDHELAKTIADEINNGRMVPAGMIPLDTDVIYYTRHIEMLNAAPTVFTVSTRISFTLLGEGNVPVDLRVFDVTGRLVKTVADRDFGPGTHSIVWDGRSEHGARVPSGVYFYRLETPVDDATGKMIVRR